MTATERVRRYIGTAGFVLACVAIGLAVIFNIQQTDRVLQQACKAVTQVKEAAHELTKPSILPPRDGSSQTESRIANIKLSNAAKAAAQAKLDTALACRE